MLGFFPGSRTRFVAGSGVELCSTVLFGLLDPEAGSEPEGEPRFA